MQTIKNGPKLYEQRNGTEVSSRNFISSDSICFNKLLFLFLKKGLCCCVPNQLPGTEPTLGARRGSRARKNSLFSPLFCVKRLKIASGLLRNKQFMDSGVDAVFAWRGQLSPATQEDSASPPVLNTRRALDFGCTTGRVCLRIHFTAPENIWCLVIGLNGNVFACAWTLNSQDNSWMVKFNLKQEFV